MENNKVIFILYSLSVGGAERRAVSIANYLVNNNFDVEILLLDNPNVEFNVDKRIKIVYLCNGFGNQIDSNQNGISVFYSTNKAISIPHKIRLKLSRIISNRLYQVYEQLEYLIINYSNIIYEYVKEKKDYKIVSWMTFANISTCYALRKLSNEKIIVECTSPEYEFSKEHPINYLKKKYYSYARKCICQTIDAANYYVFLPNMKKYVIPNPILGKLPDRYNGIRKKIIVNFCRLSSVKNIPLLIDAFRLLHNEYPEYELHIFGEGPEKDNLVSYVSKLGLTKSVLFFDFDVNIHNKIVDYTMFVSSSDREGMSNSMIEAMAIGLPTITTDCPSGASRMLIENYVNGIYVSMNDATALYKAMKYIVEHPNDAELMSIKATEIRDHLSMDRIGNLWIDAVLE